MTLDRIFTNYFVNEGFYSNTDFSSYSLVELEDHHKWSEWNEIRFKGFTMDQDRIVMNSSSSPKLNLHETLQLLKSKEWTEEQERMFDDNARQYGSLFLDETCAVDKIVFASQPRSGNSLTRKYLEDITSIITGANNDSKSSKSFGLSLCGFKGEGKFDDSVWIFKTHVPRLQGKFEKQLITKAVVCVRNPFDSACSIV